MTTKPKLSPPQDDDGLLDRLANRGFALRIALAVILLLFFTNIATPLLLVHLMSDPERVLAYDDSGNMVFAHLRHWGDAPGIFRLCAKDAAYTMFMRNPAGVDDPELLPLLFTKTAQAKLQHLIDDEAADFGRYQFHQKIELDPWQLERESADGVRATTQIQLTREGHTKGDVEKPKSDVRIATLTLHLFRNTDIATNKRYPLGVWDFDLSYQH